MSTETMTAPLFATKDPNVCAPPPSKCQSTLSDAERARIASLATRSPLGPRPSRSAPVIVSIEAAIGTGKSSLLRLLNQRIGNGKYVVVQEPVEMWQKVGGKHNLLQAYYENQERFAFSFQTNCVLTRIESVQTVLDSIHPDVEVVILERCWHSDRNTFGEMLRRHGKISELEWALYDDWYRFAVRNAPFIDGHIYLQCTPDTCMSRLRKRDRSEEVGVTSEYQTDLIQRHEEWLEALPDRERVQRIDVDREFISDPSRADEVVETIANFVSTLREKRDAEFPAEHAR